MCQIAPQEKVDQHQYFLSYCTTRVR